MAKKYIKMRINMLLIIFVIISVKNTYKDKQIQF